MAACPLPPSPSYPPINPNGSIDQNPAGNYTANFPQSPAFPAGPPENAAQEAVGNYAGPLTVTVPQFPYPASPCGRHDPNPTENYPGPQLPCPPGFCVSSDPKIAGNYPMPPPGPNGNTDQKLDKGYPGPGFQLPPGNIISQNASAPPLSSIEKVPGYEHVTFDYAILAPPPASEWPEKPSNREDMSYLHKFSREEVKDAVLQFAAKHCCYGEGFAKKFEVADVTMSSVYHYILETFGEKRESAWCFEPYTGQAVDSPMNGPAPDPWEVKAEPKKYFKNSNIKMEVPHTAFVKPCHGCASNGYVLCDDCVGSGTHQCSHCNGAGRRNGGQCVSCSSSGRRRCTKCNGNRRVKCKVCDGHGKVKGFVELTVTWTNHFDDHISQTDALPKEKIRKVSGQVVFEEKMGRVWPMSHCVDNRVNEASSRLVAKHNEDFTDERILEQRHTLQIVPIGECKYTWKNETGDFCVYGFEQKVYFPDYPQKCCCGCNIL